MIPFLSSPLTVGGGILPFPSPTVPSSLSGSTWGAAPSSPTSIVVSPLSPAPTAWKDVHHLEVRGDKPEYTLATQVVLGAVPTICKSDNFDYHTKMSVPTGYVRIKAGGNGWGEQGSIWNITIGAGAKLTDVKAACQGSACTGINGDGNEVNSGKMTQRKDGSWYMKVTPNMQAGLMISGLLVDDSNHRRRRDVRQRRYALDVSATPPCGLPVADNCSDTEFAGDIKDWEAYKVDNFMDSYLTDRGINSFNLLRERGSRDFWTKWQSGHTVCEITQELDCTSPEDISDLCRRKPGDDEVRGLMMTDSVINFTHFMRVLYKSVETVKGRIGDPIDAIVNKIWKPAAKQTWTKIMSLMAGLTGLLIAAMVILDVFAPEAAAVWTGLGVAAAITMSNSFAVAGAIGNLKDDPSKDSTIQGKAADYKLDAGNKLGQMEQSLAAMLKTDDMGHKAIYEMLQKGAWSGVKTYEVFNDVGFGANVTSWFERMAVTQYVTKVLNDNQAYILFLPFDKEVKWGGNPSDDGGFTQEYCEKRFVGDPSWKMAAACDIPFGPDGKAGMTMITRPDKLGAETKTWFEDSFSYDGIQPSARDILKSAVFAHQMYGFNYTIINQDWSNVIAKEGTENIRKLFSNMENDQPGLYNLPVCEISDMAYIPDISQSVRDYLGKPGAPTAWPVAKGPCSCAKYEYKAADGGKKMFTDYVSDDVKDSINDDCKASTPGS